MGLPEQEQSGITKSRGDMGSPCMALFCLSLSVFLFLIFKILNSLCFQKLRMEISFFFLKFLCWSIADVLVSGVQQSESGIHMHYLFFLQNSFPINITEY